MPLSLCLNEIKNAVSKHKILTILLILTFLSSTICGIITIKPPEFAMFHHEYCSDYCRQIFSVNENVFIIFLQRGMNGLLLVGGIILSSLIVFLFPCQVIILIYQGFTFGSFITIFISDYGIIGIFISLLVFLPQLLLVGSLLILSAPFVFDCGLMTVKDKNLFHFSKYLPHLIVLLLFVLFSSLLEFLIILIIFRPFTVLF